MAYLNSVRKVTVSAVMVAIAAAMAVFAFGYWARQAAHSELLLAQIKAELHALSALEWQAIASGRVNADIAQKASHVRTHIDKFREGIKGPDDCLDEFNDQYRVYISAMDREYGLIKAKKLAEAKEFDESVVDPLFDKLHREIEVIAGELADARQTVSLMADAGMALSLLSAALIVSYLFSSFNARQRREAQKLSVARELTELSSDSSWEQDEHFRFTRLADGGTGKGVSPLIIGATRWQLPVDLDASDWAAHRATLEAHQPFRNFEYKLMIDEMPVQWISSSGKPIFDAEGNFKGYRGTSRNITDRKQVEEALRRSRLQLRQLANYQEQVKEDERKRIARDIHDELGQNLLALRLDLVRMSSNPDLDAATKERISAALNQIDSTIKSVRAIMNDLRPAVLNLGLHAAVEWQAKEFERASGIACELHIDHEEFAIDEQRATAMFRSLQESLNIVIEHAQVKQVWIDLQQSDGQLCIRIADDGIVEHPNSRRKKDAIGLIGIEERMRAQGGTFAMTSDPEHGMTITLSVPV
jgi:signal transduction histidine kinase